MPDPAQAIAELLRQDRRYKFEAYAFVFEALTYAHHVLGMGAARPSERSSQEPPEEQAEAAPANERHLTGQQLCEAIRQYALEQYGYMAKCVLNNWGVRNTGDFGEIVFNLIAIGQMRKTPDDRREDFENVFDFDAGLNQSFEIKRTE
ncbi:MAG: Minf_1886 family protein [Pirellulales bacterium]